MGMEKSSIRKVVEDRANFAERFEYYIGCFDSEEQLMLHFMWDVKQMDDKCLEEFGMDFRDSYRYFRNAVISEGKETIAQVAKLGNGAALKIMAEALLDLKKAEEQTAARVSVTFDMGGEK